MKLSTDKLIEIANEAGISIGRHRSEEYYYSRDIGNGERREFTFLGTWDEFCHLILALANKQTKTS